MTMSDPIADMLTRIRNAMRNREKTVKCLNSKVCRGIAGVLQEEGYIDGFDVIEDGRQGLIRVRLRYGPRGAMYVCDWYNPVKGHAQYSLRAERRDRHSGRRPGSGSATATGA